MSCFECNLKANRIGKITVKNLYNFKLALDEATQEFQVTGKDGHVWGAGKSFKGALISAGRCGVRLKQIDTHEVDISKKDIYDVISALKV